MQEFEFCTCFIARSCHHYVHSFVQGDARLCSRDRARLCPQRGVICSSQRWEALTEMLIIRPNQRIRSCNAWQIDVIAIAHEIAWPVRIVHSTRSIAED